MVDENLTDFSTSFFSGASDSVKCKGVVCSFVIAGRGPAYSGPQR